jgi:hypothetical protein
MPREVPHRERGLAERRVYRLFTLFRRLAFDLYDNGARMWMFGDNVGPTILGVSPARDAKTDHLLLCGCCALLPSNWVLTTSSALHCIDVDNDPPSTSRWKAMRHQCRFDGSVNLRADLAQ